MIMTTTKKKPFWIRRRSGSAVTTDDNNKKSDDCVRAVATSDDDDDDDSSNDCSGCESSSEQKQRKSFRRFKAREPMDVEAYMARREMTATQERWNALTMLPSPLYCIYCILSASWVPTTTTDGSSIQPPPLDDDSSSPATQLVHYLWGAANTGCASLPIPPVSVLLVALGVCIHAPFSFHYHWVYAHRLPPGLSRTLHWSRRLDQAFIHVASACICAGLAATGNSAWWCWYYVLANTLFQVDCIVQHFLRHAVRPRVNQLRIFTSLVVYTLPVLLVLNEPMLFGQIWLCFGVGSYCFAAYPIGGWSHAVFHVVIAGAAPPLMQAAVRADTTGAVERAVWCAASRQV